MKTIELNELESINYLIEQRNDVIEHLNDVLKINNSTTEIKSLELLQNIFKINSQIKLTEDTLIVKRVVENEAQ
jgi:hypothetical protein